MPLLDLKTNLKSLRFGRDRPDGGSSNQPYVTTTVPVGFRDINNPLLTLGSKDFLLRGGTGAFVDSAQDVIRLSKMFTDLKTPSGIQFTAKQQLLSRTAVKLQAGNYSLTSQRGGLRELADLTLTNGLGANGLGGIAMNTRNAANPLNAGVYNPLSTIAQAGVNAFGGHLNKQGINPISDSPLSIITYSDLVTRTQPDALNRLIQLKDGVFNDSDAVNVFSYSGGPGSKLGIGNTDIQFADQRTGLANSDLAGTSLKTQQFLAPSVRNTGFEHYDYGAFKNPRETITQGAKIFSTGASQQYSNLVSKTDLRTSILVLAGYKRDNNEGALRDFDINNVAGSPEKTQQFLAPSVRNTGFEHYDYSVFKRPATITQGAKIFSTGASQQYSNLVSKTDLRTSILVLAGYKRDNNEGALKSKENNVYTQGNTFPDVDNSVAFNSNYGNAAFTQKQIIDQISFRTSGQIQDFRKKITVDTVGKAAWDAARKNGSLADAPDYTEKKFETRVHLGDPGSKILNRSNYTAGATTPGGKPNVVDKINALYMYEAEGVTESKNKNDFVKFRFAVINPDQPKKKTFTHFRAIFNGDITDSNTADWTSFRYLGRGEEFFNYNGFTRDVSFSFTVVAQSKPELSIMYQKLNYLQSSLTPNFSKSGYMRGNIHQLTIGGYFFEQPGVITSLNYSMPQDSTWEIGIPSDSKDTKSVGGITYRDPSVKELTHRIEVQVQFKPIHTFLPQIVGSSFDSDNMLGILGKNGITQRYSALENEMNASGSLYAQGTPDATTLYIK